jgi:hypothetical protein
MGIHGFHRGLRATNGPENDASRKEVYCMGTEKYRGTFVGMKNDGMPFHPDYS